jgi:hypothetical protein
MLGTINIVAFVPTRDSGKARSFYEGVLDFASSKMTVCSGTGCKWDHGPSRESSGIQSGTVHDSGMASYRHREASRGSGKEGFNSRDLASSNRTS